MHRLTRIRIAPIKNAQIRWFIKRYQVDMQDANESRPEKYADFNHFFTRSLKPNARPLSTELEALVSPADGLLSIAGTIDNGTLLQAKGQTYNLDTLVAKDERLRALFDGGSYANIYLAPGDYHRVHSPAAATLIRTIYVPGQLWSVKPRTVAKVPSIFARNERIIFELSTARGPIVMIMVGAVFVSSISTMWDDPLPKPKRQPIVNSYETPPVLHKGQEIARFNMGSTVIMLLPSRTIDWVARERHQIRCNETLARWATRGETSPMPIDKAQAGLPETAQLPK